MLPARGTTAEVKFRIEDEKRELEAIDVGKPAARSTLKNQAPRRYNPP
jgi:hypothetical protein